MRDQTPPLHVLVAEALGCRALPSRASIRDGAGWACGCPGRIHAAPGVAGSNRLYDYPIVRYDEDWSAIGPEIERLRISIVPVSIAPFLRFDGRTEPERQQWAAGSTSLPLSQIHDDPKIAACNLILELAAAGLPTRRSDELCAGDSVTVNMTGGEMRALRTLADIIGPGMIMVGWGDRPPFLWDTWPPAVRKAHEHGCRPAAMRAYEPRPHVRWYCLGCEAHAGQTHTITDADFYGGKGASTP